MTTQEIADRLYELCKVGDFHTAQEELFSSEATSTESNMQGERITLTGLEAIIAKGQDFQETIEERHGGSLGEAKVFGPYIFMAMGLDATFKGMGRMEINEMCRYEVKDGKIVAEEFYY